MDLKRLGYFVQIAELGSLTRASERLNIAQPSLSRQMRLLEEELGVALFTRRHRGMELTEAGEALNSRISGPLRQIGHAFYEVRALPTETGGTVDFGLPPTIVQILAGPLARRVANDAPNISLRIVDAYTGHLLDWMRRGELDAAILYGPTPSGLNATKLLEDELMLVGPPGSPLAATDAVDLRDLADLPMILPSHRHGLRMAVEAAAARGRVKLTVKVQADSFQLMKELVQSGLGYTVLPRSAFEKEAAKGELTVAEIRNPPVTRQLFLVMKPGAESPRAVLQVEAFVRQETAQLVEQGRWPAARLFGVGDS